MNHDIVYFKCIGHLMTRGEYGVRVVAGRSYDGHRIVTRDSDCGDVDIASVNDPAFVEISKQEYDTIA